jgi:hypothetical protein
VSAVAVAILTENISQLPVLQGRVESTAIARSVLSHPGFPMGPTDPLLRKIQDLNVEVVLVEMEAGSPERAAAAIELLQSTTSDLAIFAIGPMTQPMAIVAAMRAGACEYLATAAPAHFWKLSRVIRPSGKRASALPDALRYLLS